MNFKTEKVSYKVKQSKENPEEKQAVFENHHEPIIDRDTWERVQELRKQRKRPNRYDEVGLFSGILFCADCGSVMYQQRYQTDKRWQDCYICGSYKKRTPLGCVKCGNSTLTDLAASFYFFLSLLSNLYCTPTAFHDKQTDGYLPLQGSRSIIFRHNSKGGGSFHAAYCHLR